ncbi:MAG: hypothetical protein AAF743_12350, partial [Planctomycetota bacterium]
MRKAKADVLLGALVVGAVGVVIGLLFAAAWSNADPLDPGEKIGVRGFQSAVLRNVSRDEQVPRVRNVVIYPAVPDPDGRPIFRVTFERYLRYREPGNPETQTRWAAQYIDARTPFVARRGPDFTVADWLDETAPTRPGLAYQTAWWKEASLHYALFGAGWGVVGALVGGLLGRRGVIRVPTLPERTPKPRPAPTPQPQPTSPTPE